MLFKKPTALTTDLACQITGAWWMEVEAPTQRATVGVMKSIPQRGMCSKQSHHLVEPSGKGRLR